MVQMEAPCNPECWEDVPIPDGQQQEEHRVGLHVQVEHYQKKSQDHKPKSKSVPVDFESGYKIIVRYFLLPPHHPSNDQQTQSFLIGSY